MTGVLKAKVGGVWIEIPGVPGADGPAGPPGPTGPAGTSEEVFVGPSDPGSAYDLWVDTDDPASGITDPRLGVRVAWENDSSSFGGVTSEQTLATYNLLNPTPGSSPGGNKWIFSTHALCSNTGAGPINLTLRCKINGTSAIGTSTIAVPNGTGERLVDIVWELMADNDWNLNQKARFAVSGLMAPPIASDDLVTRRGYTRGNSVVQATWDNPIVCTVTGQWSSAATQTLDLHGYDVIFYATTPG